MQIYVLTQKQVDMDMLCVDISINNFVYVL